ncbi:BOLA class I histocompatibility antigen, alpha chain BL3-7-like [Clarias gariepinus]|uniref:BOLA class I histocompatibility antigen, alpha chain BL3-7-like n=1 Tax=Clarias gariepinus TaxID=13013 RepID=UPI00234CD469|nr:BOLA class I histocompatibility antigen, alpha chain BL3-7-like [Clarias gariepinus]
MVFSTVTGNLLTFLTCFVKFSLEDPHTLQIFDTGVTPGIHFPEFISLSQLDGVQIEYYDSTIGRNVPKTEWIRRISDDEPEYWDSYTEVMQSTQEMFRGDVATLMQRYNQTEGVHTVQRMYGCELDDDGSTRGYYQDGYDGEDFISLDLRSDTWIAPTPQAVITKHIWDADVTWANIVNKFLEEECIESLKKYLVYGRETLEQKVRPEVSVFHKHSSSPEVVCHATGFFPKAVMITWQKDGEDVHEDVELRETLHNQDGSFQRRSILRVPAEVLQKHTYTCVVQHSSLEKNLVQEVPKGPNKLEL